MRGNGAISCAELSLAGNDCFHARAAARLQAGRSPQVSSVHPLRMVLTRYVPSS